MAASISRAFSITRKRDPCLRRKGDENRTLWILYACLKWVHGAQTRGRFKSPPTLPAALPPPPQQLTFTQPPRGRGCSNFRHSFACATKRFPLSRCASAIQIVRPLESIAETQPKLQPALLRLLAIFFQYFACNILPASPTIWQSRSDVNAHVVRGNFVSPVP